MAEKTVTLVRANPSVEPNPRRRRRRRHRNPALASSIKQPLPDLTHLASALLGAGISLQFPRLFNVSGWMNVFTSFALTVAGAAGLKMAGASDKISSGFAVGGTIMTFAKALHVGTGGKIGLDPTTRFEGIPDSTSGYRGHVGYGNYGGTENYALPSGPSPNEVPHMNYESTGIVRPVGAGVAGFRMSEYEPQDMGMGMGMDEDPLNV